jgi:hypothetical protein
MITSDVMRPTSLISKSLPHLLHFTVPSPCVKNAGVLHFAQLACFAACEYLRLCRVREWMATDSHGAADMRLAKPFGWLFTISVAHPLSSHAFTMASRSDVSDSGSFALLITYVAATRTLQDPFETEEADLNFSSASVLSPGMSYLSAMQYMLT